MAPVHLLPNLVVMSLYFVLTSNSAVIQEYVDLGYAKHTVTTTRITARGHQIDIYKNIRYAKAPTGDLRFRYPQSPSLQAGTQNGTIGHDSTCISSVPAYAPYPPFNGTHFGSEDCLFLDVYVPKTVKPNDQIPVLHWLYGSAYAFGGKDFSSNPMGLFDELLGHHQPFVFVTSNYRMGLYGWASSPSEDMDSNIGLEDGRVALEWTQKYVHKFGGDPRDITAMGQSAGSGIVEMIIAESKYKTIPFQKAFLSSSDIPLKKNVTARRQEIYRTMLELAKCTSLACLRNLPEARLSDINNIMVSEFPNNGGGGTLGPSMGFGPFVDGQTVHDLTPASLSEQHRDNKLKGLIVGNMQNEASTLSSDQGMPEGFPSLVHQILPLASAKTVEAIQSLYAYPRDLPEKLAWDWTGDAVFFCHTMALAEKYQKIARRYVMSVPPGVHGEDLNYYFYPSFPLGFEVDEKAARGLQRLLGNFIYGRPLIFEGAEGKQIWTAFADEAAILNITNKGFQTGKVSDDVTRCSKVNAIMVDRRNGI